MFSTWAADDPVAAHAAALRLPSERERRAALGSVFSAWASSDPEAAKDAAMALTNSATRNEALRNVLGAWATSDPEAAYGIAVSLPAGQSRSNALSSILQQWTRDDPTRAMAVFDSLTKQEKESCYWSVTSGLTQTNPAAALDWARSLPGRNMSGNALSNVFSEWAATDGPAAAAALAGLPAHVRANHYQNIASQWASSDRDAALAWARSLERPADRARALSGCLGDIDLSDTAEITAILSELPKGETRSNMLANIASNQASADPEGTLAWLRSLSEDDRAAAIRHGSLQEIANSDPHSVAALLGEMPAGVNDEWLWSSTAASLAALDPQSALAWAESIDLPGNRASAVQAAIQSWAETDPDAALQYARTLGDGDTRKSAIANLFQGWANEDPEGLLDWAQSARGEERETAFIQGSIQLANSDPATGAGIMDTYLRDQGGAAPSDEMRNAIGQIANSWATQDVTSACQWAATLPAGRSRTRRSNPSPPADPAGSPCRERMDRGTPSRQCPRRSRRQPCRFHCPVGPRERLPLGRQHRRRGPAGEQRAQRRRELGKPRPRSRPGRPRPGRHPRFPPRRTPPPLRRRVAPRPARPEFPFQTSPQSSSAASSTGAGATIQNRSPIRGPATITTSIKSPSVASTRRSRLPRCSKPVRPRCPPVRCPRSNFPGKSIREVPAARPPAPAEPPGNRAP